MIDSGGYKTPRFFTCCNQQPPKKHVVIILTYIFIMMFIAPVSKNYVPVATLDISFGGLSSEDIHSRNAFIVDEQNNNKPIYRYVYNTDFKLRSLDREVRFDAKLDYDYNSVPIQSIAVNFKQLQNSFTRLGMNSSPSFHRYIDTNAMSFTFDLSSDIEGVEMLRIYNLDDLRDEEDIYTQHKDKRPCMIKIYDSDDGGAIHIREPVMISDDDDESEGGDNSSDEGEAKGESDNHSSEEKGVVSDNAISKDGSIEEKVNNKRKHQSKKHKQPQPQIPSLNQVLNIEHLVQWTININHLDESHHPYKYTITEVIVQLAPTHFARKHIEVISAKYYNDLNATVKNIIYYQLQIEEAQRKLKEAEKVENGIACKMIEECFSSPVPPQYE